MDEERMKILNDFIKNLSIGERLAELKELMCYIKKDIKEKQPTI